MTDKKREHFLLVAILMLAVSLIGFGALMVYGEETSDQKVLVQKDIEINEVKQQALQSEWNYIRERQANISVLMGNLKSELTKLQAQLRALEAPPTEDPKK